MAHKKAFSKTFITKKFERDRLISKPSLFVVIFEQFYSMLLASLWACENSAFSQKQLSCSKYFVNLIIPDRKNTTIYNRL
jgi:hypothetical protein